MISPLRLENSIETRDYYCTLASLIVKKEPAPPMEKWRERRILILGSTYPSHSSKYNETVCTGGIDEETGQMVRLRPVPMRYLQSDQKFTKFQWIRVMTSKDTSDPRPESLLIDPKSIVLGDVVKDHAERRAYLENSPHMIGSLEELKERQQQDSTSLGIVRPKDILDCYLTPRPAAERDEWERKENARLSQHKLFGDPAKPLDFPEVEFTIRWICNWPNCQSHTMHILQWGLHELYRKLKAAKDPALEAKVIQKMQSELDEGKRDVFLFLGNFRAVMYNFGLMDSYSPPKLKAADDEDRFSLFQSLPENQD